MRHYPLYTDGQLDPQAEALLDRIVTSEGAPLSSLTPAQARDQFLEPAWLGEPKRVARIDDITIPGPSGPLVIRVYSPEGPPPIPIVVFFHGGGFVLGRLNEFDPFCTFLANGASCVVVSVDYRLAPEHKHPAAVDDAVAAVNWIATHAAELHGDASRIAVAGDSAGANLAAVVSIVASATGFPPLRSQVLICPYIDASPASYETESFRCFGDGPWLSAASMRWYRGHYLESEEQSVRPFVSPLFAKDLARVPAAHLILAEFDVLRDQGQAYARRLQQAGVAVRCSLYKGVLHDFVLLPGLFDRAWEAIDEICQGLREAFVH